MTEITDTMNAVMANLQTNKAQIDKALADSEAIAGTFAPNVMDAFDLILATFGGDAKVAAQMLNTRAQMEKLAKAAGEVSALVAAVQVVIADEQLLEATQAQATANVGVANDPLSKAAGSSESPAADPAAPVGQGPAAADASSPSAA